MGWKKYVMVHLKELLHKTGALYKNPFYSYILFQLLVEFDG